MGSVVACDICQTVNFEPPKSNIFGGNMLLTVFDGDCHPQNQYSDCDICKSCLKKLRMTCYRIRKKNQLETRPFDKIFKGKL